jgi:hypothetical protein
MRIAGFLVLSLFTATLGHADLLRKHGPPPPRPDSPADLAGNWKVTISTKFSSCPDTPASSVVTWKIAHAGSRWTVTGADGLEVSGLVAKGGRSFFAAKLRPKLRPSGTALDLEYYMKDRFFATLMHAEHRASHPDDPTCIVVRRVAAERIE